MNRTEAPVITHQYTFELLKPNHIRLANGVDVYYIEGGKQDVFRIDVLFKAGNIFENKNLVSSGTNDLLGEGTTSKSSLLMNEAFDFYGAYIQRESSRDYAGVSLFGSDKHLKHLLPLLFEVISESNYPQHEFDIYIKNRKARFEDSLKKVDFVCRNEFTGLLFGSHPYGLPLKMEDFKNIDREALYDWYQQYYLNQIPIVFVTGRVSNESKAEISGYFSQLQGKEISFPDIQFNAAEVGKHSIQLKGAIQSAIRIGRPMVTLEHDDYPALSVMNTLLGGYFGSRLMKNIREEKGFTYGIGSGLVSFEKNGMWMIATEVGKDVTDEAIKEIYKEIDYLKVQPVGDAELETVKNYILGNFIKSIDGPFNQSDKIKTTILRNLDPTFYQNQIRNIQSVSANDVLAMANKYLRREEMVELIVGG